MNALPSYPLGLAAAAVIVALVLWGLAQGPGPQSPRPAELPSEEEFARPQSETLERLDAKLAVMRDVIEGRLPLAMAARKFHELDRGMPPSYWVGFRAQVPGRNDAERSCQQVVRFVAGELDRLADEGRRHPDHEAILGRVRAELELLLADGSFEFQD